MSKLWGKLIGEEFNPNALSQTISQINNIEKTILAAVDAIVEPDYIGDYIQKGGLIGLEPMGFNAPRETIPDVSHTRLAQVAVNHRQLENSVNRFKESLKKTFDSLNQSLSGGNIGSDTNAEQALANIVTCKEKAKQEISALVLKPKTVQIMYSSFEIIDENMKRLRQEFDKYAKL